MPRRTAITTTEGRPGRPGGQSIYTFTFEQPLRYLAVKENCMASPIVLRLTHPSNGTPCCRRLRHTGCQPVILSLYPHPFPAITLSLYSALIVNQADDGGVVQSRPSAPTPTHTTLLPWLLHDASRGRLNKLGSDGTRAAPTHAAHGCGSTVSLPMHVRILHVRGLMFERVFSVLSSSLRCLIKAAKTQASKQP